MALELYWTSNVIIPAFIAVFALLVVTEAFQLSIHPPCDFLGPGEKLFKNLQDISELLHGNNSVQPGVCVFNPSVIHYDGDIYLWAARVYVAADKRYACSSDYTSPRPPIAYDRALGTHFFLLAATLTAMDSSGTLTHKLIGHKKMDIRLEDPRFFRDDVGDLWLLAHNPRGPVMTVSPVDVSCSMSLSPGVRCDLRIGGTRILWYTRMMKREKNWVPHNGTTRMSYPIFPSFAPHCTFNWGSYREPRIQTKFDTIAPDEPFFVALNVTYRGWLELSGSTPAILHDDGESYVALGHIRAYPLCYHKMFNSSVSPVCVPKGNIVKKVFKYEHRDGQSYLHHAREYALFVYRFSAEPPYEITHVSHAFVPCTFFDSGIVYPGGLTRVGPLRDYLISFGEADRYSRVMTISAQNMDKLLVPIKEMRDMVNSYRLCSVPC